MLMSVIALCKHRTSGGKQCKAHRRVGDDFCFFHSPETIRQRRAARKAGGISRSRKASALPPDVPEIVVRNSSEVCALLTQTINQVRRGQIDARIANSAGYLSGILMRGLEQGQAEERLARLELALGIAGDYEKEVVANANQKYSGSN